MTAAVDAPAQALSVTHRMVEAYLYREARLLDEWRLREWFELFTPDGEYFVPPAGAADDADPMGVLFYIEDDYFLLAERVERYYKRTAHSEFPHSILRRLVTNIEVLDGTDDSFKVAANYLLFRSKNGVTEQYFGHYLYELRLDRDRILIRKKTAFIDQNNLNILAKVSVIL